MIILVGGLGDPQYLNDQLKDWRKKNSGLTMLCPAHPYVITVVDFGEVMLLIFLAM